MFMDEIIINWKSWLVPMIIILGTIVVSLVGQFFIFRMIRIFTKQTTTNFDDLFVKHCRNSFRWLITLFVLKIILPAIPVSSGIQSSLSHLFSILLILSVAWFVIKLTYVLEDFILSKHKIIEADNLRARAIYTQLKFLKKIVIIIISIFVLASILMSFKEVRQFGTSILASAGIISILVGFASQRYLATFFAGFQIAITQPIRIDDVVVVENEWGRIEEITLTNVVVKLWDLRRLVLPITYFIEKPFQNWTRKSADIVGTVYLYTDYSIPVQAIRDELNRILENSEFWDHKVSGIQVTNVSEHTVELRALMSASDSSKLWDLRCEVREKLITYVQKNFPGGLPKIRAELREMSEKSDASPV
jgi:small-conductance mechanosensitive channel